MAAAIANDPEPEAARILVVEDEVFIRMDVAERLREAGYTVVEAVNADEAQAILSSSVMIDLVLTDVRMPGSMDGAELAKQIKHANPSVKVIVASGHAVASKAQGSADAFFTKPYDFDGLLRKVQQLLDSEQ